MVQVRFLLTIFIYPLGSTVSLYMDAKNLHSRWFGNYQSLVYMFLSFNSALCQQIHVGDGIELILYLWQNISPTRNVPLDSKTVIKPHFRRAHESLFKIWLALELGKHQNGREITVLITNKNSVLKIGPSGFEGIFGGHNNVWTCEYVYAKKKKKSVPPKLKKHEWHCIMKHLQ